MTKRPTDMPGNPHAVDMIDRLERGTKDTMSEDTQRLLICNCEGTMPLDIKALSKARNENLVCNTQLCRAQLDNVREALKDDVPLLIACTQEAPLFEEIAAEAGRAGAISYVDIRERAGWSEQAGRSGPKIAALLAEAALEVPDTPATTMESEGVVLVYGGDETALAAARQLAGRMDVTCVLRATETVLPPRVMDVPVFRGDIVAARGHLGAFEITIDGYAPLTPSSRASLVAKETQDGARSSCDLILDLSGQAPLFPGHEKRDGYFRPDPGNPALVQRALFDMVDMVGTFEKPRYVRYDATLCVHSRSGKIGCTRCLDNCPTGAIVPAGDQVSFDPFICAGCGACASVCPTGAARYDLPAENFLYTRLRTLLETYRTAGGRAPALLIHDTGHGEEMISAMARGGRGLPAHVLPFAVNRVTQIGFDFMAVALAYGAAPLTILTGPSYADERDGLASQIGLCETLMTGLGHGSGLVTIIDGADPEAVERALHAPSDAPSLAPARFLVMGGKRSTIGLALDHLHAHAPAPVDFLPLPADAPFGTIAVDVAGCTLCLSCVGACPTGALRDNPDKPQFSIVEEACVQCGLCRVTCPESVITLTPRFNFTETARDPEIKKEEEPFACIRCGTPFGARSSIERMVESLAGHAMFAAEGALDRVKMCPDCRVIDQAMAADDSFAAPPRPVPRTTEDYLREDAEREAADGPKEE